jgi:S1-C subfamily serine protease
VPIEIATPQPQPSATQTAGPSATAAPTPTPAATATSIPTPAAAQVITKSVQSIQNEADPQNRIFEAVYEKVNRSVVQVSTMGRSRRRGLIVPQGVGSGFVWDAQGDIVTNDHVVAGATQLQVTFADGTVLDAQLVGTDPNGDIAVIKVDPKLVTLAPVEAGDVSTLRVGQRVIAIGNPFGLAGTMTQGIVSALGRSIPASNGFSIPEAIQTDAAINPGNSGGPLLNESGQVIGINDQIQTSSGSSSGVGFAIPMNIVARIVPALIRTGQYQHSYPGFEGQTYSRAWAQALGFPATAKGAYVLSVAAGGPADQAGLRAGTQSTSVLLDVNDFGRPIFLQSGGDLITRIDDQPITKLDDLLIYLEEKTTPGQTVRLTILRAGNQQQTISIKLDRQPSEPTG